MSEYREYSEFQIDSLFQKLTTKRLNYRTNDLPSSPQGKFVLPALTAGVQNQGLANYVPREGATILQDVISVSANGANTGVMFFQSQEFTVLQDAYAIDLIDKPDGLNRRHYLYLVGALQKTVRGNYSWTSKAGWERIRTDKIVLPVLKDGQIDYDYMARHVKRVEAMYLNRLEAYLETTGFSRDKLGAPPP